VSVAFASNLDELILENQQRVWIHGHTHESFDYRIGETGIGGDPRGCASTEKNKAFWMPDQVRHDDSRIFYEIVSLTSRT
jgi:predicted phosphodiesterase